MRLWTPRPAETDVGQEEHEGDGGLPDEPMCSSVSHLVFQASRRLLMNDASSAAWISF